MTEATAQEILLWAEINRARLDPAGEAARYGIDLNEGGVTDFSGNPVTLTANSKQPLAFNANLTAAAEGHSQDMMSRGFFAHNDPLTGSTPQSRAAAAGYAAAPTRSVGENIDIKESSNALNATTEISIEHQALFTDNGSVDHVAGVAGRGHRYNILLDDYNEVGVGQSLGTFGGMFASDVTEDFGKSATVSQFLTGIAYNDTDGNAFYSAGEGRGGITVATAAGSVATATAGEYSEAISVGVQTITFSGGDLVAPVAVSATIAAGRNALIDLVGQSAVETSVSLTALTGIIKIIGLGNTGLTLTGNGADNTIVSAKGNDVIDGAGGFDTAVYSGNKASYTITTNANGTVTVSGLDGTDTLTSIEKLQFVDQSVVFSQPAVAGSVAISDVTVSEGSSGTKVATFTVTRTGGTAAFDVGFATSDGTATVADGDYLANAGTLHFGANVNTQTVAVTINGDVKVESNEAFNVLLSGATNGATISDGQGIGTITNDDAPAPVAGSVSINDVTITEGNSGTKVATFTVTRTGGTAAFDVTFATANGTAMVADGDYAAKSGTLHFGAGVNTQTVAVTINGDAKVEADEAFSVLLSGATNGATISDGQGIGTITNDDAPAGSVSINDVTMTEGNSGTKVATFTVTRTGGTAAFDVKFATANGTATVADGDYVASTGTLHFGANVNTQTISVTIKGDTKVEADEAFTVALSAATNGATISDAQGVATITNDDAAPVNHAPVVTASDFTVSTGNAVAASSLFAAHDQEGDKTITRYAFWDGGSGGGHFTVNGVTQASGQWIYVNAASLATIKYVGGTAVGSESLFVAAYDGKAWSTSTALTANTIARAPEDFNGDGNSDVLLRNDNGSVAMWQMNGTQITANKTVGTMAASWSVAGTGDFNGDGKSDILWTNTNGSVALWQMNGSAIAANQTVGTVGKGWQIVGAGDFNGDGKADILLRSDTGAVAEWQMNGKAITSNQTIGTIDPSWKFAGTGDFNGDGKADILWRNDNGAVAEWQMNGNSIGANQTVGSATTDWHVAGIGDLDGDGKSDIFWQNDSGLVAGWEMDGNSIKASQALGSTSPDWKVADIGDYNKDGHADILFRNAQGAAAMWEMNGAQITANQGVGSAANSWHIA